MTKWIETAERYDYLVRESDSPTEAVDRGNGITVYTYKDSDGTSKTTTVSFSKSNFGSIEDCQAWLTKASVQVDKVFTKKAAYVSKDDLGIDVGPSAPTQEQLAKINTFTRTQKTEQDVVVFPTLACNDLIDRDIEAFTPKALKQMVELDGDLGIPGKSLMLSHNYKSLPTGRLFDAEAVRRGGMNAVRIWTYVPNTDQYKSFIENIDYGVFWAVSIGARLKSVSCSICGGGFDWLFNWACLNGHEKGSYYDPNAEGAKAASSPDKQLCYAKLEDPIDFFELSVVFLGAQYAAAFEKNAKEGFLKAASADIRTSPELRNAYDLSHQISLKTAEIDKVFTAEPVQYVGSTLVTTGTEAKNSGYTITINNPVSPSETTAADLRKIADAIGQTISQGLLDDQPDKGKDKGGNGVSDAVSVIAAANALAERVGISVAELRKGLLSVRTHAAEGNDPVSAVLDSLDTEITDLAASLDGLKAVAEVDPEDKDAVEALLSDAKIAIAPELQEAQSQLEAMKAANEQIKSEHDTLKAENSRLQLFAKAGENYIGSLRKEAVRLYRVLQAKPGEEPDKIDVSFAEKIVEKCGNDLELLEHLVKDYEAQVRIKLPGEGLHFSSVDDDPAKIPGVTTGENNGSPSPTATGGSQSRAVRVHG